MENGEYTPLLRGVYAGFNEQHFLEEPSPWKLRISFLNG
jgi:hypothetical protein